MRIEAFGDRTVIVRSYPQILGHFDGESFFADLLAELDGPKGARHVDGRIDKIVQTMACKGAVKAGQRLSADQIRHILQRRSQTGAADTCPHGRPTTIFLSHADLDKQFHRT
jgi:DNA mismatch repair protein MutL